MKRGFIFLAPLVMWVAVLALVIGTARTVATPQAGAPPAGAPQGARWTIPPGAAEETNPLTVNDAVIGNGTKLFASKCQRCHGPEGKGDGPDGDTEHMTDMNLTVAARAARNPDGVVFYKVWNGRATPKMPAFSEELSKEQVWAIVAYVQTLRAKQ